MRSRSHVTKLLLTSHLLLQHLASVEHVVKNLVYRLDHDEQDEDYAGVDEPDIPDECCEILQRETKDDDICFIHLFSCDCACFLELNAYISIWWGSLNHYH